MMKYLVSVFVVAAGIFIGCEDSDPDYPIEPFIEFKNVRFYNSTSDVELDSIVLRIAFRDGDGDLGLDWNQQANPEHNTEPYHYENFFVGDNGTLSPMSTYIGFTNESPPRYFGPVLKLSASQEGRLVTLSMRDEPEYSNLPANTFPDNCFHYENGKVYLLGNDVRIVNSSYNVEAIPGTDPPLYEVTGIFYVERNPDANNIFVDYLVKQPDGSFELFDWSAAGSVCLSGFHSRFPPISNKSGIINFDPFIIYQKSKYSGEISFAMKSVGFIPLFSGKTLKLRISIKDRALHTSNVIETHEFTLESIK